MILIFGVILEMKHPVLLTNKYFRSEVKVKDKTGLPRSGKNIWKMTFFPGQGKSQGILWMAREI